MDNVKSLRINATPEEMRLWYLLRGRRFYGFKFRRQVPVGPYVVDFACYETRLIVELDGGQHADQVKYDVLRTAFLQKKGWHVLRFWNNELREFEEGVLMTILAHLQARSVCTGELKR
ncbi:DNA-cytosine methyltransferase [Superficieibacter electus]|uniref:DNA-cytosine methyltransferase n=1 Tax=Superficieibacter electus TaxID=2022662 RepID=A0A2P5GSX4_9ENTR|nr:endonuclease domain-containing protein [Superficieibacter electus]POP46195.1 DNA-cytosine methyltransferase [Superficieibacter electus]POP49665.1 DNA-cytosine methyltransferase [Superficieibacter electus]